MLIEITTALLLSNVSFAQQDEVKCKTLVDKVLQSEGIGSFSSPAKDVEKDYKHEVYYFANKRNSRKAEVRKNSVTSKDTANGAVYIRTVNFDDGCNVTEATSFGPGMGNSGTADQGKCQDMKSRKTTGIGMPLSTGEHIAYGLFCEKYFLGKSGPAQRGQPSGGTPAGPR